jgi:phage shock protein PspC (stress-responsive transcriptional regulator)
MTKLYRSQRDRKLFGVCGGLAETMRIDATLLRLAIVVLTFFTGGITIPLYFVAALVMPKEPGFESPAMNSWTGFGPGSQGYGTGAHGFGHGTHGYGTASRPYGGYASSDPTAQSAKGSVPGDQIDHMMQDLESKAMLNEIRELKAKLAKYEKGEN